MPMPCGDGPGGPTGLIPSCANAERLTVFTDRMKMKRHVRRFDYGQISSAERTPQGFLKCPGFATRTGVFPYMDGNGKVRRELRHPDDVFDPESLETLKNAPVTIEHPPEMINPKNVAQYRKGHTTDRVEVNRELVETDIICEDQDAIDAVEKEGIRELSCGYDADIVEESGTYNGAPYDYRQKKIIYNHLALVKRGRAGPEVRLRMDSADAVMQAGDEPKSSVFSTETGVTDADEGEKDKTKKVVFMGEEVDLPSHIAEGFQDLLDRFDEMRAKQSIMEEESMAKRADVDVSQKGISPQVKVEQQTPDGRSAPGKTPAKPGTITGPVGKADDEKSKDDGDEHGVIGGETPLGKADEEAEDKKDDEPASEKGGGASESDIDRLKKDMDEKQAKHDAEMAELQKKHDAFAAASQNQPEKKPDGGKMDSADMERKIRARVKLERQAEKLVPFETAQKFDSMSDDEILAAAIKYRSPKADLTGKSSVYLQQRFDSIVEAIAEEGTSERHNAGKALLGISGGRMDSAREDADPSSARLKMVSDTRELWKQPLSASKK
jgi:hypothetical protein